MAFALGEDSGEDHAGRVTFGVGGRGSRKIGRRVVATGKIHLPPTLCALARLTSAARGGVVCPPRIDERDAAYGPPMWGCVRNACRGATRAASMPLPTLHP